MKSQIEKFSTSNLENEWGVESEEEKEVKIQSNKSKSVNVCDFSCIDFIWAVKVWCAITIRDFHKILQPFLISHSQYCGNVYFQGVRT